MLGRTLPMSLVSLRRIGTHEISYLRLVNGAAIEASVSEIEMPTSALLRALQSLAPSPTIAIWVLSSCRHSIKSALSSGDILAYTLVLSRTFLKMP
jgi:hypothetical protein